MLKIDKLTFIKAEEKMKITFIKNILIALLLCFAVACTTADKENNGNDSNNSNNGGNNGGGGSSSGGANVSMSGKDYASRMQALEALFKNTTLGTITITIAEDQWKQMISNTNNGKKTVM